MTMTRGIGTPYYMSPEMLRGDGRYTRAVDVYSFGIMCVELWNERLPYAEMHFDTPVSFALYVLGGNRPKIRKDCPRSLVKLCATCWCEDRLGRPPFDSIVNDIVPILEKIQKSMPEDVEHVQSREPRDSSPSPRRASNANEGHHGSKHHTGSKPSSPRATEERKPSSPRAHEEHNSEERKPTSPRATKGSGTKHKETDEPETASKKSGKKHKETETTDSEENKPSTPKETKNDETKHKHKKKKSHKHKSRDDSPDSGDVPMDLLTM